MSNEATPFSSNTHASVGLKSIISAIMLDSVFDLNYCTQQSHCTQQSISQLQRNGLKQWLLQL